MSLNYITADHPQLRLSKYASKRHFEFDEDLIDWVSSYAAS
jgi:hypothetical protein